MLMVHISSIPLLLLFFDPESHFTLLVTARNRSKVACVKINTFTPVTETVDQVSVAYQEELAI